MAAQAPLSQAQEPLQVEQCLRRIVESQNFDGGWGVATGDESAIEPTAWALRALTHTKASEVNARDAIRRGCEFLLTTQLTDGSWPFVPGLQEGCWVTSLVCGTLWPRPVATAAVLDGVDWLCRQMPSDATGVSRVGWRLFRSNSHRPQGAARFGWPRSNNGPSEIEPTAFALQALHCVPMALFPQAAAKLRLAAIAMLAARTCPGGGWSSGTGLHEGPMMRPEIRPTVWVLLALRQSIAPAVLRPSVEWLEEAARGLESLESMAAARLGLRAFGVATHSLESKIQAQLGKREERISLMAVAWGALASCVEDAFPARTGGGPR